MIGVEIIITRRLKRGIRKFILSWTPPRDLIGKELGRQGLLYSSGNKKICCRGEITISFD